MEGCFSFNCKNFSFYENVRERKEQLHLFHYVSLLVVNEYSLSFMSSVTQVLVVEPANDWDQSEIVCPDVINPGEFFVCKIDIPYGNKLVATVTLADNIYPVPNITTGPMKVPGIVVGLEVVQKRRHTILIL
jgi:hypothetical protein